MVSRNNKRIKRPSYASEVSEVRPWLLLSGAQAIRPDRLSPLGLTHIVSAAAELPPAVVDGVLTSTVGIVDTASGSPLGPHLHQEADRLECIRTSGGRVLVHCVAGVSRSSSLILGYLIKYERMKLRDAFLHLRNLRPVVRPNSGFFAQLLDFEKELLGSPSVVLLEVPDSNLVIPDVCEDELSILKRKSWSKMIEERKYFHNHFT